MFDPTKEDVIDRDSRLPGRARNLCLIQVQEGLMQEKTRPNDEVGSDDQTGFPADVVLFARDPMGVVVYLTKSTMEGDGKHSRRHPELKDIEGTRSAIEDPEEIAEHAKDKDRRVYLGKPRTPASMELAPPRRWIVTDVSTGMAKIITLYDHCSSQRPSSMGRTIYDASAAAIGDGLNKS
jgi:hypothetical protein